MTYDARQAAFKEQDVWVQACIDSMCQVYISGPNLRYNIGQGVRTIELCSHPWCHGVVDVLNRAYGNEHVSYRMPEERDPAVEKPS